MSLNTCLMFSAGSLLSSGFHIGSLLWFGAAYLALLLSTFVSSFFLSLVLNRGLLLVPFARTSTKQSRTFSVVGPSIWNGLPSQLRTLPRALAPAVFLTLRLLFLAVLESGAPLSSSLEEALYKSSI